MICGRSRGPADFGRMGAADGRGTASCMLKVSHTLAARGCVRLVFDAAVVAGLSFPSCVICLIRRFVSSFLVVAVGPGCVFISSGLLLFFGLYDLRCVASPPLEIVQCLREIDSCLD